MYDKGQVRHWLERAHVNAQVAKLIVEQDNPVLLVEAVTQLQQATEKAAKALLLANGASHAEVKALDHVTVAAFLTLLGNFAKEEGVKDLLSQMVAPEHIEALSFLINASFPIHPGKLQRHLRKDLKRKLLGILPPLKKATPVGQLEDATEWHGKLRLWPDIAVDGLLDIHKNLLVILNNYFEQIDQGKMVDPRPLLRKEVNAVQWAFSKEYAGLPPYYMGRELPIRTNRRFAKAVDSLIELLINRLIPQDDSCAWPESINLRQVVDDFGKTASNWVRLYLIGAVTMPHAITSRYPAEEGESFSIGSQDYNESLGVIKCIRRLAHETEETICMLREHYGLAEIDPPDEE